jgi:hypothetical protein
MNPEKGNSLISALATQPNGAAVLSALATALNTSIKSMSASSTKSILTVNAQTIPGAIAIAQATTSLTNSFIKYVRDSGSNYHYNIDYNGMASAIANLDPSIRANVATAMLTKLAGLGPTMSPANGNALIASLATQPNGATILSETSAALTTSIAAMATSSTKIILTSNLQYLQSF